MELQKGIEEQDRMGTDRSEGSSSDERGRVGALNDVHETLSVGFFADLEHCF